MGWDQAWALRELLPPFLEHGRRPTIRLVRRYWQIRVTAPDCPTLLAQGRALDLATAELLVSSDAFQEWLRDTEAWLAFGAWTADGQTAYEAAVESGHLPGPPDVESVFASISTEAGDYAFTEVFAAYRDVLAEEEDDGERSN